MQHQYQIGISPMSPEQAKRRQALEGIDEAIQELTPVTKKLLLIQAACLLAQGGVSRAQVSEICSRTNQEYQIDIPAWEAGTILAKLGITSVTSHGKSRLVLDIENLTHLHEQVVAEVDEQSPRIKETLAFFDGQYEKVVGLHDRLKRVLELNEKEKEIRKYLAQAGSIDSRLQAYEQRYAELKARDERATSLEKAISELEANAPAPEALEKRKHALEENQASVQEQAQDLAKMESQLGNRLAQMQQRLQRVRAAEIEQALEEGEKELRELEKKLGEKRGLLSKMFGSSQS